MLPEREKAFFFFFNDTATTEIYTLSLHDALPISARAADVLGLGLRRRQRRGCATVGRALPDGQPVDRKSTRLNSSHSQISYAVFCLKKKIIDCTLAPTVHNQPHTAKASCVPRTAI